MPAGKQSVIPERKRRVTFGRISDESNDFGAIRAGSKTMEVPCAPYMNPKTMRMENTKKIEVPTYIVHKGVDISNGDGNSYPVYSPITGEVVFSGDGKSSGFWPYVVVIREGKNGPFHRFGHLSPIGAIQKDPVPQYVTAGSLLGFTSSSADNSRYSLRNYIDKKTGKPLDHQMPAHLHYEITRTAAGMPDTWQYRKREAVSYYYDPLYFLITGKHSPLDYQRHSKRNLLRDSQGNIQIG